ncbi:hypothetical protein BE21_38130 [Sorangium cellulosum]|uniref:Uncharacterized protein n=1 Tax=Sorangium cellulosum TaxID=56 RepID=A0A150TMH9_SORCE|nr:hypothetical protein BE21_38130 [Sorangium cellulosum]
MATDASYRARMTPILSSYGGAFGHDFIVARVLKGDARINRVFTLLLPDRATRERQSTIVFAPFRSGTPKFGVPSAFHSSRWTRV